MRRSPASRVTVVEQEEASNGSQDLTDDLDAGRKHEDGIEPSFRSPQEFFAEVTKRPDIDEILKRLANI